MAEKSGFFDAHLVNGEYDRVYLAESFAKYFASFISNGVFGGKSSELMVQQKLTPDMSVNVLPGQGWINGYWYENDSELSLAIDVADGVLNRIDSIVLRWNNVERVIRLAVKKGTPSSNPSAPTVQRDADYYELKLAQVFIKAGATKITQVDISDTRLNEDVCGLVVGTVQQLDTQEFGKQLGAFVNEFIEHSEDWFSEFENNSNSRMNTFMSGNQAKVDKLLSDGQTNIDNVVTTGQQNIAKVASSGVEHINSVAAAGKKNMDDIASAGQTNLAKVVSDGQKSIDNVVTTGTTNINKLISDKTTEVNQVIAASQAKFDKLDAEATAWFANLSQTSEADVRALLAELEGLIDDNDLASLNAKIVDIASKVVTLENDVAKLKSIFIESTVHPGCYYRIIDGETEWVNCPGEPGPEYRTTERWFGNPVYKMIFYVGILPNKTMMAINANINYRNIISIEGFAVDVDNNMFYPFPIILNGLTPAAVIQGAEGDGGEGSTIIIQTNDDLSQMYGCVTVKYTKQ